MLNLKIMKNLKTLVLILAFVFQAIKSESDHLPEEEEKIELTLKFEKRRNCNSKNKKRC